MPTYGSYYQNFYSQVQMAEDTQMLQQQGYVVKSVYTGDPGLHSVSWTLEYGPSPARAPVSAPPPQTSVVTGIDPSKSANALYGKIIPLSALGLARIGTAGLIFGPYFNSGLASFAVSFGFPVNPAGTRLHLRNLARLQGRLGECGGQRGGRHRRGLYSAMRSRRGFIPAP